MALAGSLPVNSLASAPTHFESGYAVNLATQCPTVRHCCINTAASTLLHQHCCINTAASTLLHQHC
ncbi:MAG: hypothetical protein CMM01_05395, partial [Rhodopirellula sp.]|nr:hypothetical protein [Rhodopirellula sp.]